MLSQGKDETPLDPARISWQTQGDCFFFTREGQVVGGYSLNFADALLGVHQSKRGLKSPMVLDPPEIRSIDSLRSSKTAAEFNLGWVLWTGQNGSCDFRPGCS